MAAVAGFCFVGCSDDVIDVNNQEVQEDNTSAYLTVSFASKSTSSRSTADDANNQGDKDGSAEDSGHMNTGTDAENAINSVLVVVKDTDGKGGYAKYYTDLDQTKEDPEITTFSTKEGKFFKTVDPIEINTGVYEVLVVANPHSGLISTEEQTEVNKAAGTDKADIVTSLYNKILTGSYNVTKTTVDNYAGDIVQVDDKNALQGIMMCNKTEEKVEVKAGNLENTPAVAEVIVERVASKITYRHYGYNSGTQKAEEIEDENSTLIPDVYPVHVTLPSKVVPITYEISNVKGDAGSTDGSLVVDNKTLNEAICNGKTIYVVINEKGTTYYDASEVTIKDGKATLNDEANPKQFKDGETYTIQYKTTEGTAPTWYVKLEKYALVNLAKSVYNVRHTTYNGTGVQFGVLDGNTNYLYTPNWTINGGINNYDGTSATDAWFFNTLKTVSDDSKPAGDGKLFNALDWSSMSGVNTVPGVTGTGNQHTTLSPIGNLLAYCLENSTEKEHQTHGLSTGIAFMAKIYNAPACGEDNKIKTLYRYAGHLFTSVEDIQNAYNVKYNAEATEGLASLTETSDIEKLTAAGVVKYDGNTCYYYSTEIKHFDNDDPLKLGNMEFAIMRNNIYSLAVTGINIIGDPWVDPTPSTPNEILNTYLTVQARIEPWIVRYHDIEFN